MLVKYKNLESGKLTEERDVFIDQLYEKFEGEAPKRLISSIVKCFANAIFKENRDGIVDRTNRGVRDSNNHKHDVKCTAENFLNEIEKILEDKNNIPEVNKNIYLTIGKDQFWTRYLNFLVTLPLEDTEYLEIFEKYYTTEIPKNLDKEFISMVIRTIFENIKEATIRGLNDEEDQSKEQRVAEEKWIKACSSSSSTNRAEEIEQNSQKRVRFSI